MLTRFLRSCALVAGIFGSSMVAFGEETPTKEPAAEEKPAKAEKENSHKGLLPIPLRVGPTASVGFPFLLNYGVDAIWDRTWGLAIGGGRFKREINADTSIEVFNFDIRGRWFPWQGSFFLGAAYGNQGIVGKIKSNVKTKSNGIDITVPTEVRLEVATKYLTPHLGWMAVWDCGFTLGFELGMQVPMSSKAEVQTGFQNVSTAAEETIKNSEEYKKAQTDVEKAAESFGKKAVPYVNLLKLGWLF